MLVAATTDTDEGPVVLVTGLVVTADDLGTGMLVLLPTPKRSSSRAVGVSVPPAGTTGPVRVGGGGRIGSVGVGLRVAVESTTVGSALLAGLVIVVSCWLDIGVPSGQNSPTHATTRPVPANRSTSAVAILKSRLTQDCVDG